MFLYVLAKDQCLVKKPSPDFESIKNNVFLWNQKISFCSFSYTLDEKETDQLTNQISTSMREFILKIIITLFIFWIHGCFGNLNKKETRKPELKYSPKLFCEVETSQIESLFSLNENGIVLGAILVCEKENIASGRSYVEISVNITHCFFSRYSFHYSDGGVIYVNGGSYSMNVNFSMFYNCLAQSGGAIFFVSSNAKIKKICANRCSCGDYNGGHFASISASQMNEVEYLSISNCSDSFTGEDSIELMGGFQRVDNTNSSMNNANRGSGLTIKSPSLFTSSFCVYSNNIVSEYNCLYFYSNSGTISMSYANIVHNNSPYDGVVFVDGDGIRKMNYCIFQNNQNYLFCVWSGSLEVSHSFFDFSGSFSTSTAVSTTNDSFTIRMTYQIQFFNSLHCNADISERTISETQNTVTSEISWIVYSVFSLLFVVLLVFLVFYRSIATNLLARHQLEDSLQCDFG